MGGTIGIVVWSVPRVQLGNGSIGAPVGLWPPLTRCVANAHESDRRQGKHGRHNGEGDVDGERTLIQEASNLPRQSRFFWRWG